MQNLLPNIWKLSANTIEKIVCKYLNLLEFQIPAFRAFCKTAQQAKWLHVEISSLHVL